MFFGKKRKNSMDDTSSRGRFEESAYVKEAVGLVGKIRTATSVNEIQAAGRRLDIVLKNAVSDRTSVRDLITILQFIAQGKALSQMENRDSPAGDFLLDYRVEQLERAFYYLDRHCQ